MKDSMASSSAGLSLLVTTGHSDARNGVAWLAPSRKDGVTAPSGPICCIACCRPRAVGVGACPITRPTASFLVKNWTSGITGIPLSVIV